VQPIKDCIFVCLVVCPPTWQPPRRKPDMIQPFYHSVLFFLLHTFLISARESELAKQQQEQQEFLVPNFSWAQRNDKFWIKIELVNVINPDVTLLPEGKLLFKGVTKEKNTHYKLELEFFGPINVSQSTWEVNDWNVLFTIQKKQSGPYWPRLLKSEEKLANMKIDWTRYRPDPTEFGEDDYDDDNDAYYNLLELSKMKHNDNDKDDASVRSEDGTTNKLKTLMQITDEN
jgi:prostaglandin-E synthase